jgi:hypothetical protein
MNFRLCHLFGWVSLFAVATSCSKQKIDSNKISLLREQIDHLREEQAQQNRTLSALKTALSTRDESWYKEQQNSTGLRSEVKDIQQQLSALSQEFAAYKERYRHYIRKAAPELTLGDVVINGQLYRNLKIKTLDDSEICFSHAGGFGKADSMALPVSLREKFVIDADKADSAKLPRLESQRDVCVVDAVEPQTLADNATQPQQTTSTQLLSSSQLTQYPLSASRSKYAKSNFSQSIMDQKYRRRGVIRSRVNGGAKFNLGGAGGSS